MKPLDPRLMRYARAARGVFGLGAVLGFVRTVAIIAWSWFLANAIAAVAVPSFEAIWSEAQVSGRVADGVYPLERLPWLLACAMLALLVRAFTGWGMDVLAARGAVRAKGELRAAALDRLDSAPGGTLGGSTSAQLATTLGRGLDALDGYFSGYVPQLILAVVATPILVAVVLIADVLSGVTVLLVFPVIPLFMILIGLATQAVQSRQWAQLQKLSASFVDVVEGLSTLKVFRRERRQVERIARETDEYRSRTMKVLRVTFLSGFVLDLAGTFSIALVAVTVGTRLVAGDFPLALGLFILLLLPEVFVPIRQVGAAFHASTEGLAATAEVCDLIEGVGPGVAEASKRAKKFAERGGSVRFDEVTVRRGEHIIGPISFEARPGELVAIAGPSGAGKSSLIAALLGFAEVESGEIARPSELGWAGQRPGLVQGTIAENVALGDSSIDREEVKRLLSLLGLEALDIDRALGAGGTGLSGGQAHRVAIARALYRASRFEGAPIVLDEPSAALDEANEHTLLTVLEDMAKEEQRAVLIVSHRPAVLERAQHVVQIHGPEVPA